MHQAISDYLCGIYWRLMLSILRHDENVTITVAGVIVWAGTLTDWSRAVAGAGVRTSPKVA